MEKNHRFDVIIIGAGLSGIGGARYLQKKCSGKTYAILEARSGIGGTWDFFRYPGLRSDSDMYTMGYAFKPWAEAESISDGEKIRDYIANTAKDEDIISHIRFQHKVVKASWSSQESLWKLDVAKLNEHGEVIGEAAFTCQFIISCAGYYKYDEGYTPEFKGRDQFAGPIIHPQNWPKDFDAKGQRIVVIGSGATAVTLVPNLAKTAAHVTMLQRTPTYMVSRPAKDKFANILRRILPQKVAYSLTRWRYILLQTYYYRLFRKYPQKSKERIIQLTKEAVGERFKEADFTPWYNPWEQRLCLVTDGDLFEAMKDERASIVTDQIESFTHNGILLKSGHTLDADVIVTATGFNMQLLGGIELYVDGNKMELNDTFTYKGVMFSNIPNLFAIFGYINASWTLKVDVFFTYVCRMLNYMERQGFTRLTPRPEADLKQSALFIESFSSGYLQRSINQLPKQGPNPPWQSYQNYFKDLRALKFGRVKDPFLDFQR